MSSNVIPFALPEPTFIERVAARRAYRQRCREVAKEGIGRALSASLKGMSVDLNDALPIFTAAMRRELRRSGLF